MFDLIRKQKLNYQLTKQKEFSFVSSEEFIALKVNIFVFRFRLTSLNMELVLSY